MFLFDISCYMRYYIYEDNDMGLDNYWMKNKEELGHVDGDFKICGGMLSGSGNDSFRGKVYHRLVEDVTGVSLYGDRETNEIPIETVKEMADDLEATAWQDSYIENYDIEKQEFEDLVRMFRLHVDAGHYLVSSW